MKPISPSFWFRETYIPQFLVSRNLYPLVFGFAKRYGMKTSLLLCFTKKAKKLLCREKKISKEANIETLDTIATITLYIFSCDLQFNKYIYSYQKKELLNREKSSLDFHRTFCQNYNTVCHLILLFVLRKQRLQ